MVRNLGRPWGYKVNPEFVVHLDQTHDALTKFTVFVFIIK